MTDQELIDSTGMKSKTIAETLHISVRSMSYIRTGKWALKKIEREALEKIAAQRLQIMSEFKPDKGSARR